MLRRLFAMLCALLLVLPAAGAEPSVLDFKAGQSGVENWIATALPGLMGKGGEWYAIALSHTEGEALTACRAALEEYVSANKVRSAVTHQKLALTLLALGSDHEFIVDTAADSIGKQGVMSWAWGLHLLNNGCKGASCSVEEVIKTLLSLRKADGGWAINGSNADVDATAMVLQALAPHRADAEVASAVDAALTLLSRMQLAGGGFASYGVENAESAAQVIIALCALGIDPLDARFVKNGASLPDALRTFRLPDGSYSHEMGGPFNENATAQAFLAETAYACLRSGQGNIYLVDGSRASGGMKTVWSWQTCAMAVIGGAALLICAALLIAGKRHPKNFLAVAVLAGVLIGGVMMLDVQSAEEYYAAAVTKKDAIGSVTLSIRCDKVAGRAKHIPEDGCILPETSMPVAAGDTAYTILTDAARLHGFHMEASGAPGMMYVHGIGNVYEFDFGDLSGWLYTVNGETFSVGCDQYMLQPGDRVAFRYTLELGRDME